MLELVVGNVLRFLMAVIHWEKFPTWDMAPIPNAPTWHQILALLCHRKLRMSTA